MQNNNIQMPPSGPGQIEIPPWQQQQMMQQQPGMQQQQMMQQQPEVQQQVYYAQPAMQNQGGVPVMQQQQQMNNPYYAGPVQQGYPMNSTPQMQMQQFDQEKPTAQGQQYGGQQVVRETTQVVVLRRGDDDGEDIGYQETCCCCCELKNGMRCLAIWVMVRGVLLLLTCLVPPMTQRYNYSRGENMSQAVDLQGSAGTFYASNIIATYLLQIPILYIYCSWRCKKSENFTARLMYAHVIHIVYCIISFLITVSIYQTSTTQTSQVYSANPQNLIFNIALEGYWLYVARKYGILQKTGALGNQD